MQVDLSSQHKIYSCHFIQYQYGSVNQRTNAILWSQSPEERNAFDNDGQIPFHPHCKITDHRSPIAIAIAAGMRVDSLAKVPLSFPTYAGILGRAAYRAAQQIYPEFQSARYPRP